MQPRKKRSPTTHSSTATGSNSSPRRTADISLDQLQSLQTLRIEDLIGYLLRCAENVVTASYYTTFDSAQITHRQLAVLVCLNRHGRATQTELAMQIRIDRSTINEMIPRMVERGLIARDESSSDRRAFEVRLTEAGRVTLQEIIPNALAAQEKVLDCLPKEYRKIFRHCLELIIDSNEQVFLTKSLGSGKNE